MVHWVIDYLLMFRVLPFAHHPVFHKVENATFRKLDLFPSSGEERNAYSVGSLRKN
jgi:hypothetical protein